MANWRDLAECGPRKRNLDPELFFPKKGTIVSNDARLACGACQVRRACLAYGLRLERDDPQPGERRIGIWGGYLPGARSRLVCGKPAVPIYELSLGDLNRGRGRDYTEASRRARESRAARKAATPA